MKQKKRIYKRGLRKNKKNSKSEHYNYNENYENNDFALTRIRVIITKSGSINFRV